MTELSAYERELQTRVVATRKAWATAREALRDYLTKHAGDLQVARAATALSGDRSPNIAERGLAAINAGPLVELERLQMEVALTEDEFDIARQEYMQHVQTSILDLSARSQETMARVQESAKRDADKSGKWVMVLTIIMALSAAVQVGVGFWQAWLTSRQMQLTAQPTATPLPPSNSGSHP